MGEKIRLSLRDKIRKYETEKNTKVRGLFKIVRCLHCPMSAISCPIAKLMMK